jgi:hypothetical protein
VAFGTGRHSVAGRGAGVLEVNVVRNNARPMSRRMANRKGGQDRASAQVNRSSAQYDSAAPKFRP